MKKYLVVVLVMVFSICMFGCREKEAKIEESQEPMSMEALSAVNTGVQTAPEVNAPESKVEITPSAPAPAAKLEPLPPAGPYKPTNQEIQAALKNAGYYAGPIDGKIGPLTKKAIKDFQQANGLEADGKVGPKTWAGLGAYLNPAVASQSKK